MKKYFNKIYYLIITTLFTATIFKGKKANALNLYGVEYLQPTEVEKLSRAHKILTIFSEKVVSEIYTFLLLSLIFPILAFIWYRKRKSNKIWPIVILVALFLLSLFAIIGYLGFLIGTNWRYY